MEKKPYNPILGEQYFAQWTGDEETGDIVLEAEQVSHHPPVSIGDTKMIEITPISSRENPKDKETQLAHTT